MKTVVTSLMGLAVLAALAWGGFQLVTNLLNQRYEALTTASAAALARGDTQATARLAVSAMQGRDLPFQTFDNRRATALLRDALMEGQAPLVQVSTKQFPLFVTTSDVIPPNATIGSDGKRLMILHNEDRAKWIIDIYDLPSGRLLRQFPLDASSADNKAAGTVTGFSPDLSTTILWRTDGLYFRDTESDRPVLTDFKAPAGFYAWSVSNDRRLVTARDDKGLRIWEVGTTPASMTDIVFGTDGDADDFDLAPGGKLAITGTGFVVPGGNSRTVIELPSRKIKLSWRSNGPIDAAFSQDGHYVVTSVITGETANHLTWTHGARIWDLTTGRPVGPLLDFGYVEAVQTLFQGRIMVITTFSGARFFDLETGRLVGTDVDLHDAAGSSNVTDTAAYAIDRFHLLVRYNLNPLLAMTARDLTAEACHRWGAKAQMNLTAPEMEATHARFRIDPCV